MFTDYIVFNFLEEEEEMEIVLDGTIEECNFK